MKKRFGKWGPEGRKAFQEVDAYQRMVKQYADAIKETRELKQGS